MEVNGALRYPDRLPVTVGASKNQCSGTTLCEYIIGSVGKVAVDGCVVNDSPSIGATHTDCITHRSGAEIEVTTLKRYTVVDGPVVVTQRDQASRGIVQITASTPGDRRACSKSSTAVNRHIKSGISEHCASTVGVVGGYRYIGRNKSAGVTHISKNQLTRSRQHVRDDEVDRIGRRRAFVVGQHESGGRGRQVDGATAEGKRVGNDTRRAGTIGYGQASDVDAPRGNLHIVATRSIGEDGRVGTAVYTVPRVGVGGTPSSVVGIPVCVARETCVGDQSRTRRPEATDSKESQQEGRNKRAKPEA